FQESCARWLSDSFPTRRSSDPVLQVGPCPVLQIRDQTRDGYDAVQLGFLDKPRRKATRPERGHVSADLESRRRRTRTGAGVTLRSEEHTSELQSRGHLVCRLLL